MTGSHDPLPNVSFMSATKIEPSDPSIALERETTEMLLAKAGESLPHSRPRDDSGKTRVSAHLGFSVDRSRWNARDIRVA
jgi:hypothetical protein